MATTTKKTKKQTEKVLDAVVSLKPQSVIEEIGVLQSNLQNTLAGLSAQISTKLEQMRNVEEAITIKQEELVELYGIDAEALTLEEMRAQCEQEDAEFEKKVQEREAQWQDDQEERTKRWQREEEEHAYEVAQRRKRAVEDFNIEAAAKKRAEAIRQEDLAKEWKTREESIALKEKDIDALKAQVATFDDRLKSETGKAEAIAINRLKKEYEHEVVMLKKDVEAERSLNSTKVSALDDNINGLQAQIGELQKQLVQARNDAKEITSAALASASGRQAMEAVQRVVDQPTSTGKGK